MGRPADVVDVFVWVGALNLAVEYLPAVISGTFTVSLLTALLLRAVLEVLVFFKEVELGGLVAMTGLIVVLMLARAGVRKLLAEPIK